MQEKRVSSFQRAKEDTENFRNSAKSFWLFEIIGAAMFGLVGAFIGYGLIRDNANHLNNLPFLLLVVL